MGKIYRVLALLGAILLATFSLSGCTDTAPVPGPETASATSSSQPGPNDAMIFEVQKSSVMKLPAPGTVLKQLRGTGSATFDVGPLPEGQKQLGATALCGGTGDWEFVIASKEPGWSKGTCSMTGGGSASYVVDDPSKNQTVEIKVAAGVQFWLTVYTTE